MTGLVAVIMIFSIPIIAIITGHLESQSKRKQKVIKEELELERLRHENFKMETEKLRLEVEKMKLEDSVINLPSCEKSPAFQGFYYYL